MPGAVLARPARTRQTHAGRAYARSRAEGTPMHELRLVAVSEDGTYAVLVVPGRGGRFSLPIDDRLRAVARGQHSRLAQYEIEVESPLRPKEIQERIRAGESADEIADAAGVPIERVRWFEGPVLAERAYKAQEAQSAMVRPARRLRPRTRGWPRSSPSDSKHWALAPRTRSGTRPSATTATGRSSWCSAAAARCGPRSGSTIRGAGTPRRSTMGRRCCACPRPICRPIRATGAARPP